MKKSEIICYLSIKKSLSLSLKEIVEFCIYYFHIDCEDFEFYFIPQYFKDIMDELDPDALIKNPDLFKSEFYIYLKPALFLLANTIVFESMKDIKNSFLVNELKLNGLETSINDDLSSSLFVCPCCGYSTIKNLYDICQICFWQDDGVRDQATYSSPNGFTLREGRENFEKYNSIYSDKKFNSDRFNMYERKENYLAERDIFLIKEQQFDSDEKKYFEGDNIVFGSLKRNKVVYWLAIHETLSLISHFYENQSIEHKDNLKYFFKSGCSCEIKLNNNFEYIGAVEIFNEKLIYFESFEQEKLLNILLKLFVKTDYLID